MILSLLVSIPYERESLSKGVRAEDKVPAKFEFQFPTNGKAYPKSGNESRYRDLTSVSIPYERESLSKDDRIFVTVLDKLFQFPTNGKAYPKLRHRLHKTYDKDRSFNSLRTGKPIQRVDHVADESFLELVSIPYERESLSKVEKRRGRGRDERCFNSLRTGKPIQRQSIRRH